MHHANLHPYNLSDKPNLRLSSAYGPTLTVEISLIVRSVYDAGRLHTESHIPQSAFYKNTFVYHATYIDTAYFKRLNLRI